MPARGALERKKAVVYRRPYERGRGHTGVPRNRAMNRKKADEEKSATCPSRRNQSRILSPSHVVHQHMQLGRKAPTPCVSEPGPLQEARLMAPVPEFKY